MSCPGDKSTCFCQSKIDDLSLILRSHAGKTEMTPESCTLCAGSMREFISKNKVGGAGRDYLVCFLYEYEDLDLDAQYPCEKPSVVHALVTLVLGAWGYMGPRGLLVSSLA